ncbi:conserved hypothetical protein [Cupriavidus taiwanensis]|uniref:Uncharacterized protein n=1 Tax=Cupriavidus taiwanensis TaxID=164546 RepID=A0A375BK98_9BURK|nr:conserved hypothetical protein [Cupriavidus taiwanensis]
MGTPSPACGRGEQTGGMHWPVATPPLPHLNLLRRNQPTQRGDRCFRLLVPHMPIVQPDAVAVALPRREDRARRDADAGCQRGMVQGQRIEAGGKLHPQEVPAIGPRHPHLFRKVLADRVDHAALLHLQHVAQLAQVLVVAAMLQIFGQRHLRRHAGRQRGHQLEPLDRLAKAARRDPADAEARRQGLGERAAMHHQAMRIEGLGRQRAAVAEIEFAIDVVLDQRHLVARQQGHQRLLLVLRHAGAERILELRHEPARLDRVARKRRVERAQVDAFGGVDRDLDGLEPQPLQCLQRGVEAGRFDRDHVARLRHRHQAQVQRLERAIGDDQVFGRLRRARAEVAQRDLAAQRGIAGRQVVDRVPRVERAAGARQRLAQPLPREQLGRRKGRAELHQLAVARAFEHGEHQLGDVHLRRHLPRRARLRLRQLAPRRPGHVVAGALARPHQPALFQPVIGLERGRRADAVLGHGLADRRQARARGQAAVADIGGQGFGQGFVPFHGGAVGAAALSGLSPGRIQLIRNFSGYLMLVWLAATDHNRALVPIPLSRYRCPHTRCRCARRCHEPVEAVADRAVGLLWPAPGQRAPARSGQPASGAADRDRRGRRRRTGGLPGAGRQLGRVGGRGGMT